MSFPVVIAEKALLSCGRHCCLCHKFCGTKIELHHIVQKADNGEDSFENCIPLCFDCHAEVKSYNPKHPKGRKFTNNELLKHRDSWYAKVKDSGGTFINVIHLDLDRVTFIELRSVLPSEGIMLYVKKFDFCYEFDRAELEPLYTFINICEKPEFEFIDIDLEGLKVMLLLNIKEFRSLVAVNSFVVEGNISTIHRTWKEDKPELFKKTVDEVHSIADKIWDIYCDLIKLGRRKLGV